MEPSILTLFDSDEIEKSELASALENEGFVLQQITTEGQLTRPIVGPPFAAVLVFSQFDPARIFEAFEKLSEHMRTSGGNPAHMIACGPELIYKEEKELRDLGFNKVIQPEALNRQQMLNQPENWRAKAAAQRVLAAVYGGFGTAQNGRQKKTYVEFEETPHLYLECEVPYEEATRPQKIIGGTHIMRTLFKRIKAYSSSPDSVLIRGETGTGKELVAAAIAERDVKAKRYETINIAEIPSDLVPSELFGHSRGAYTGADKETSGILVEAGSGTVFLDEIGDLDSNNQARLLRVLANRQLRPLGKEIVPLKARLIFATNRPLEKMCFRGKFRQDLYQRLKEGHRIDDLPPLRERKGDLELLTEEIFNKWYESRVAHHENIFTLDQRDYDKIVDLCIQHEFSGNVRALRGILCCCFSDSLYLDQRFNIERLKAEIKADRKLTEEAVNRSDERIDTASHLPSITFDPSNDSHKQLLEKANGKYFPAVYKAAGKNPVVAIEVTKLSKKTFYNYLSKYLPPEEYGRAKRHKESEPDPDINDDNNDDEP
jgi:Transcriptional regulator containing PAS, AAA-type ATPase, and DNA-binding domains